MPLVGDRSFKMKMREMENAFRYRRIPYPKRYIELITLLAISSTLFLFFHTNKLNSRLKEMEDKIQPSEFTALGLTGGNHLDTKTGQKHNDINTLQGTYQYLKSTGQLDEVHSKLLNNTEKAEIEILFFNRLEKVGSNSMHILLKELSKTNDFDATTNIIPAKTPLQNTDEEDQMIAEEIIDLDVPSSYMRHANFINFTRFGLPRPIYMNMIREPIDKVISAYYFLRHPYVYSVGLKRDSMKKIRRKAYFDTTFNECVRQAKLRDCIFDAHNNFNGDWRRFAMKFCGNLPICANFNSQTAAQIAMRNIEQEYAVVGSWEDTNITLTVLEHYIPRFFRGATKIFNSDPNNFHRNETPHKTQLDPDIEAKLRVQFAFEIEVYNFAKQRLYKQYIAIKKDEVKQQFDHKYRTWSKY